MNLKKYLVSSTNLNEFVDNENEYKKSLENVKNLSLGLILKQYVYSFLYWIYMQNPEYSEYLTPEDLTNYFLHKIDHPFWFVTMCEELIDGFDLIVDINDSIGKYFGENIFDYTFKITPIDKEGIYNVLNIEGSKKACVKLTEHIYGLCKELNIAIPPDDKSIYYSSEAEAALRILLAVQKERESVFDVVN